MKPVQLLLHQLRTRSTLSGLTKPLSVALERMVETQKLAPHTRPFVVVEDVATRRFVQFCTVHDLRIVLIDLPDFQHGGPYRDVTGLSTALEREPTPVGFSWTHAWNYSELDYAKLTELAVEILEKIHLIEGGAEIEITEEPPLSLN